MDAPGVEKQPGSNLGGATGKGFMPGQSGNPAGRPKNPLSMTVLLRKALQEKTINGAPIPDGKTAQEAIVDMAIREAYAGDFRYFKEIFDRIDGKVPDRLAGPEGESLIPDTLMTKIAAAYAGNVSDGPSGPTD